MSDSYRKPYFGNADGAKEWKLEANRKIRRNKQLGNEELKGSRYKKLNEVWDSPMENKGGIWDVPKMRRK